MAKTKLKATDKETGDLAVRVAPATAREIKRLAKSKDQTVSKWLRRLIEGAMEGSK
jgi:hypothetical protein